MFMKKVTAMVLAFVMCLSANVLTFAAEGYTEVVPPKYDFVEDFSEGMAMAATNSKGCGYIDKTGKEVVPLKYDYAWDLSEGLARVKLNGKYGFIALTGNSSQPAPAKTVKAAPSAAKVYINGKQVSFDAYNIGGSNYFKLRDIGKMFDFAADYDGGKNAIMIDTSKPYAG